MGNEICIKIYTEPGDEIIAGEDSHIVVYETGGPGLLSGVQIRALPRDGGIRLRGGAQGHSAGHVLLPPHPPGMRRKIRMDVRGRRVSLDDLKELWLVTREAGIRLHMDGARIWNASVASGVSYTDYARYCDSVSVCFSKGLGAPVGSMIISDRKSIELARRYRKIFGGGMRQSGILAAGAEYALRYNLPKLGEDHEKAAVFASELAKSGKIPAGPRRCPDQHGDLRRLGRRSFEGRLHHAHVQNGDPPRPERETQIRAVTHLDVSREDVITAGRRIAEALLKGFRHRITLRVRNYQVDWQGIVHNAIYLEYFETGRIEYLRRIGRVLDLASINRSSRVVLARNEIDYISPAKFDDLLEVGTKVSQIGTSSFIFEGVIWIGEQIHS